VNPVYGLIQVELRRVKWKERERPARKTTVPIEEPLVHENKKPLGHCVKFVIFCRLAIIYPFIYFHRLVKPEYGPQTTVKVSYRGPHPYCILNSIIGR